MPFCSIPDVLEALRQGRMVVLVDDEDRENEGDLVLAAQHADAKAIAFMATKACGLICLAMDGPLLDRLGLPLQARDHRSRLGTAFTLSIEAREGVTTGISAADRARTIQVAVADGATPTDIVSPGHIFPLRARDGGVLVRAGHSEASVDLCRLAGLKAAAVICEIMQEDGTMARLPDLERYARTHGLLLASIADLIAFREAAERLVEPAGEAAVPAIGAGWKAYAYRDRVSGDCHLALVLGDRLKPGGSVDDPVLVRVTKEVVLRDAFGAFGEQAAARASLDRITQASEGVLLYLHDRDGRGIPQSLTRLGGAAPAAQPMDPREYGLGAQILRHLGVRKMRLISSADRPLNALSGHGLEVVERISAP